MNMNNGNDLHYNGKYRIERYTELITESKEITPENKKAILEFFELCQAQSLSKARLCKTLWQIRNFGIWMGEKNLLKATKRDIIQLVNIIQEKYPESHLTISDYKQMLKKFYKHMLGEGKEFPDIVSWIDTKPATDYKINPSEIFTEEDTLLLLQASDSIRNKAMISFLYDSGVRVGELLTMRIGDLDINGNLWHVTVSGKTGQRTFPIFPSIPYFKDYLNEHPRRNNKDAIIWCRSDNPDEPISYTKASEILRRIVKRSGIRKPANPHNFRHSAVTRDATFMSDQELKRKYGWSASSRQLQTYSHIRTEHLDHAYKKRYGLEETHIESKLLTKLCPFCHM